MALSVLPDNSFNAASKYPAGILALRLVADASKCVREEERRDGKERKREKRKRKRRNRWIRLGARRLAVRLRLKF